jgi:hypothetical protein
MLVVSLTLVSAFAGDTINDNEQKILDALSSEVKLGNNTYAFPVEYVNQAKNYFLTVDIDEETANTVVKAVEDAFAYLHGVVSFPDEVGGKQVDVFDLSALDGETKAELLKFVEVAANAAGLSVEYDSSTNTASLVDAEGLTVFENTAIIKKTGSDSSITSIVIMSVAILAVIVAVAFFLTKTMVKSTKTVK